MSGRKDGSFFFWSYLFVAWSSPKFVMLVEVTKLPSAPFKLSMLVRLPSSISLSVAIGVTGLVLL